MKKVALILWITIGMSCKQANVAPSELIGKWSHTYSIQNKDANGNWGEWHTINTLVAIPVLEFTDDGKILYDGKTNGQCCSYTNYKLSDSNIEVSNQTKGLDCSTVKCGVCSNWVIDKLDLETLELEQCSVKARYSRLK